MRGFILFKILGWSLIAVLIIVALWMAFARWSYERMSSGGKFSCEFETAEFTLKTNHFVIYGEEGAYQFNDREVKVSFEQAFDYSFWLISTLSTTISPTTICLYQSPISFQNKTESLGLIDDAIAFYDPVDRTVHFHPLFNNLADNLKRKVIVHEIMHFSLDNYLSDRSYDYDFPHWFLEGLSEQVSEKYDPFYDESNLPTLKSEILENHKTWAELSADYSGIDEKFDSDKYYVQSYLILKYLSETFGENIIREVITLAGESKITLEESLEKSTSKSLDELENDWLNWLSK